MLTGLPHFAKQFAGHLPLLVGAGAGHSPQLLGKVVVHGIGAAFTGVSPHAVPTPLGVAVVGCDILLNLAFKLWATAGHA